MKVSASMPLRYGNAQIIALRIGHFDSLANHRSAALNPSLSPAAGDGAVRITYNPQSCGSHAEIDSNG
jgi:hypothetical protein